MTMAMNTSFKKSFESRTTMLVTDAPNIPAPPFWGVRVKKDYDLRELFRYINETALFKNQWQLKTASQSDYLRVVDEKFRPILLKLQDEVAASGLFAPAFKHGESGVGEAARTRRPPSS